MNNSNGRPEGGAAAWVALGFVAFWVLVAVASLLAAVLK
jgi:hypothetical protein